jgi:hypothetical protein
VDEIKKAIAAGAGAVGDFAESVKNKVSYGVYGTNDDPEVQRAIIAHTPDKHPPYTSTWL